MTTLLIQSAAAGFLLALACGDSKRDPATPGRAELATPKPAAGARKPADLCSLLTEEEAEGILGKKLEPPQQQKGGDCWYLREGGQGFGAVELIVSVLPTYLRSAGDFDDFVAGQVKDLNENMKKAGGQEFAVQRVGDAGAPAYYLPDLGLYVFQGGRILVIGTDRVKAVAIAAKALPRFK